MNIRQRVYPNQLIKSSRFKFIISAGLVLALFIIFLPVKAQKVTVTVDATSEKIYISPYIYGKNNNLSDQPGKPLSQSQWQKLKDLGITLFRESGGNNSTKYNWKRKLTSHPDWYNNVYSHDWDYAARSLQQNIPSAQGMWAFQLIGKAAKTGAYNFNDWGYNRSQWWSGVQQNLCGGGVVNPAGGSDALSEGDSNLYLEDWPADSTVRILNKWFGPDGLGLDSARVKYWGMDNEPEIWSGTHDDVMPEQLSAENFMQMYFDVAKKARAKFPGIKLCGPVPANEWQWYNWNNTSVQYNGKPYVWLEYFILRVAEEQKATGIRLLDVLDIHFYPGETRPEDIVQLHRVFYDRNYVYPGANGVRRIGGWNPALKNEYILGRCGDWLIKYMGADHGVTFGISEMGINTEDSNVAATWYASTLGEFARNRVEFFTPWSWKKGMFEVLHLFRNYGQDHLVQAVSSDELYVSAYPMVSDKVDSMALFLVNRHTTEKKLVQIDIQNFTIKDESIFMYSLSHLPSNETFVSRIQNALKKETIQKPAFNITVELEPLSVNAVILFAAPARVGSDTDQRSDIKIYPNPSRGRINLELYLSEGDAAIQIFNSVGFRVLQRDVVNHKSGYNRFEQDISELPDGVYFVKFIQGDHIMAQKFLLQRTVNIPNQW